MMALPTCGELIMNIVLALPLALLFALSVPAFAKNDKDDNGKHPGQTRGAPGPILGAGLPVILIGGGIYWLVRKKKRASQ
jgi:hypothetical protein